MGKSHLSRSSVHIMQFVRPVNSSGFSHRERTGYSTFELNGGIYYVFIVLIYSGRLCSDVSGGYDYYARNPL